MSATNFSKNLKFLRKQKGLTQLKVRTSLGFTRCTFSNYETGLTTPSLEGLLKLARFFAVPLDDIIIKDLEKEALT